MCLCLYLFNWEVTIHVWLSFICFQVTLLSFLIETEVSFLDYIKGGYVIGSKPFLFSQFHCNSLIICICTLHMMTLSSICKELYCFLILEAVLSYIKPADSYWCKLSYGTSFIMLASVLVLKHWDWVMTYDQPVKIGLIKREFFLYC